MMGREALGMLLSMLMGLGATVAAELEEELYLVVNEGPLGEETRYIVLDEEAPLEWFGEERRLLGHHGSVAPLKAEVSARYEPLWLDREVEVFDEAGQSCSGRVVEVNGLVRVFSLYWLSQGRVERELGLIGEPVDDGVARRITELGGAPMLVAEVELSDPLSCEMGEPVWARHDLGTARPLPSAMLDESQVQELVRGLRDLDGYEEIQRRFEEQVHADERVGRETTWSRYWGARPQVWAFEDNETERIFAMVAAQAGMGCGEFFGELTELFELVEVDGLPKAVRLGALGGEAMIPMAMVARRGQQLPDIIGWSTGTGEAELLVTHQEGRHRVERRIDKFSYECGC